MVYYFDVPLGERKKGFSLIQRVGLKILKSFSILGSVISISPSILFHKKLALRLNHANILVYREIFELNTYELNILKFKPEVIIDLGAHVGMFSVLASARFPESKLFCFEPNPENITVLKKNIQSANSEIITKAVSNYGGTAWFTSFGADYSGRLLDSGYPQAFQVEVLDFVKFLEELKPTSLLLKMDIEGEEKNLLPKIVHLLPQSVCLFFETHYDLAFYSELKQMLELNNFRVEMIRTRNVDGIDYTDAFAIRQ